MHNPGQQVTNIVIDSQDLRFLTDEVGITKIEVRPIKTVEESTSFVYPKGE
jgi:hypothetical protein